MSDVRSRHSSAITEEQLSGSKAVSDCSQCGLITILGSEQPSNGACGHAMRLRHGFAMSAKWARGYADFSQQLGVLDTGSQRCNAACSAQTVTSISHELESTVTSISLTSLCLADLERAQPVAQSLLNCLRSCLLAKIDGLLLTVCSAFLHSAQTT